jgi:hypothetical protein
MTMIELGWSLDTWFGVVTPELIFLPYASTTRVIGCSPMMDPYLGRVVLSQSTLIRALMSE